MHEFSICQVLVEGILSELEKVHLESPRLVKARIVVGELRQIVPEYLQQAYEIVVKGTIVEGSSLDIKQAPVVGECSDCGWKGELLKDNFCCGACGSGKLKVVGGMELYLDNLEVETAGEG